MALFQRVTKTRVWATEGHATIKTFMNAQNEKSVTIKLQSSDLKTHAITLYAGEFERLKCLMESNKFSLTNETV